MHTNPIARVDALIRDAAFRIERAEARLLMAHALRKPAAWLFAHGDEVMEPGACIRFEALVNARAEGQPIAYLTGRRSFWDLELRVTPDTLIPRPETERLVELALERLPSASACRVADLGTGSGAVAPAIARARPLARVIATDSSAGALEVARTNAREHGVGNVGFRHGSWYAPLAGERFDVIASNPPYIAEHDRHLSRGDLRFEPASALASGTDGLDAIREIVSDLPGTFWETDGCCSSTAGSKGAAVRSLLVAAGFADVESALDLEQRERVSLGRWAARP